MKKICNHCHFEYDSNLGFCPECGAVDFENENVQRDAAAISAAENVQKAAPVKPIVSICRKAAPSTGKLLKTMGMMSMYEGEPTIGISKASGDFIIYDDRIEFKKKLGNALGSAFSLAGMIIAHKKAMKEGNLVYHYRDLSGVRMGKYMGSMPTIVLTMLNGTKVSFAGLLNTQGVREAVRLIGNYVA